MAFSKNSCAVVLLWYGKPRLALRALQSIALQSDITTDQVFCYDNGSQASHGLEIREAFPQFNHLAAPQNGGYAGGFNASLNWAFGAGFESALFLTSDTELTAGALQVCLQSAHQAQADLIAPQVRFRRPPQIIDAWGGYFDPGTCQLGHYRSEPQSQRLSVPWDYIPGTALWISQTAFTTLGGVDPDYFMYWEDVDLSIRAHQAGLIQARSPAIVLHGGGETCAKKPLYTAFYYQRNRIRFCRLHLFGSNREQAHALLTGEFSSLFERWQAAGDAVRCTYIAPLQNELELW